METRYFTYANGKLTEEQHKPIRHQHKETFSHRLAIAGLALLTLSAVSCHAGVQASQSAEEPVEWQLITTEEPEADAPVGQLLTVPESVFYEVPNEESGAKRYMDYHSITNKNSVQWQMQLKAWTDGYGFRRYGNAYMVAMGTYYAKECGKTFRITLQNGFTFDAIIGDIKRDCDTDAKNQHRNGNVVEFIVDTTKIPTLSKKMGDVSYSFAEMNGKIQSIEEII